MPLAKIFKVKEDEKHLRRQMKYCSPMISKRLHALLLFKQNELQGISKRTVAERIGVNHNSVQTWRSAYIKGGIRLLKSHSNTGNKPSKINKQQEKVLGKKLNDPHNGIVGFVELLHWFNTKLNTDINYKTFHGFVVRKFKAKIKVARKSHINKDVKAVKAFKKTSVKSVKR